MVLPPPRTVGIRVDVMMALRTRAARVVPCLSILPGFHCTFAGKFYKEAIFTRERALEDKLFVETSSLHFAFYAMPRKPQRVATVQTR